MTRSITRKLAPIVEALELERPTVVTAKHIAALAAQAGVTTDVRKLIQRLAARGWLLPTGQRGTWEFAPAERAGPYGTHDPFVPLRGGLLRAPTLPVRVALGSALWLHDLADRGPDTPEIAVPPGTRLPAPLQAAYRVTHYAPLLPARQVRDLPVHHPASVLVHLAERPTDVRSWGAMLEVLPRLLERVSVGDLQAELQGRARATRARLGYLIEGRAPHFVTALELAPADKVWFGPRRRPLRYDPRWRIVDTVLPMPPHATESIA